jgi:RNA polymerase-binding transcription factor DksA
MAKSIKKSKKPAAKAKPAKKAKKTSKVAARKPIKKTAKKVVAKKVAPKKPVAKKVEVKTVAPKKIMATPATKRQEANMLPKTAPQLNIFPALTQRPIAHKPAKASSTPDDKTRYSDEELREFETLINGKLEKARDEFRILKDTLNRSNDAGTDSTSGGNTKVLEDGAETAEKENLSQLAARQLKYITNLENALIRIKNSTYGICTVTGKLIPKERLIAVPHTTQSIEAKMMQQE